MLKIYTAYAKATVYYEIKTIANSEDEARENIANNNEFSQWDAIDEEHFEIYEMAEEELENA
jgi:hypothetical protein